MRKLKSRSFVYDALFVIVVMIAAMASAFLEAGAFVGEWPSIDAVPTASSTSPNVDRAGAAGPPVDGAMVSVATPRSAH